MSDSEFGSLAKSRCAKKLYWEKFVVLKYAIENAAIFLQIFGGLEMMLGWAGHRWPVIPRRLSDFMVVMGALVLVIGIWVNVEEKRDWFLTPEQRQKLLTALDSQTQKFEIWFYPLGRGTGNGADRLATDMFQVFRLRDWPVGLLGSNWVAANATGLIAPFRSSSDQNTVRS